MTARTLSKDQIHTTYGRRASHYDLSSHVYGLIGYRLDAYRRSGVEQLRLKAGDTVVEIGCGTGANFAQLVGKVGSGGKVIGIDLSAAMLDRARARVDRHAWSNVTLVEADATSFSYPGPAHGVLATYALSIAPGHDEIVGRAAATLAPGGRFVVVDIRKPGALPNMLFLALLPLVRPFGVTAELQSRRPWEALARHLDLVKMEHRYLGTTYIAVAERRPRGHDANRRESR